MMTPSSIIYGIFRRTRNEWHEDSPRHIKPSIYLKISCDVQFEINSMITNLVYNAVYEQCVINNSLTLR